MDHQSTICPKLFLFRSIGGAVEYPSGHQVRASRPVSLVWTPLGFATVKWPRERICLRNISIYSPLCLDGIKKSSEAFNHNITVLVCRHLIFVLFNHPIQWSCRDLRTYTALFHLLFCCSHHCFSQVVLLELCGLYFGLHLFPLIALVRSAAKKHCITPTLGHMKWH